jgi:predicted ATPase
MVFVREPDRESRTMIRRIQVSNFRSLGENVSLDLGPLTVLVGQNASGKSNVADVLQFVADTLRLGLERAVAERHGFGTISRSGGDKTRDVSIRVDVENEQGTGFWELVLGSGEGGDGYRIVRERGQWDVAIPDALRKQLKRGAKNPAKTVAQQNRQRHIEDAERSFECATGEWLHLLPKRRAPPKLSPTKTFLGAEDWRFDVLEHELQNLAIYRIFPDRLREAQRPEFSYPMRTHGENWASVLRHLDKATAGPDFLAAMGQIVGDVDDYRVSAVGGYLIPEFRHIDANGTQVWRGAVQESDGTLRIAGILTALLQSPPLGLIGIEEPEQTIHPGALGVLFDYIREASTRSQILLTTHSSELLDRLDVDEIRVVERQRGVTTVSPVDETQRSLVKKRLATVGELVFGEGLRGQKGDHG